MYRTSLASSLTSCLPSTTLEMHILFRPHLLIYHDFALEIRSKFVPDVSSMQPFDLSYTDTYIYTNTKQALQ